PWSEKALAAEATVMLAAARMLIRLGSERDLVARIGGQRVAAGASGENGAAPAETSGESTGVRIGAMLERVARHTWWRSMCLEKALAGRWMLRRRGIPSTMYVGMAKRDGNFIAHAWLVGEGRTVTGASTENYATLAAFRER
ncbi:MAG TPA: lasso peptide biosynthesis B2 protein, partial [Bryobacteraceae bacterium]|nr:lasso peptide biosynthesis B2 protein [Bryobacteraceae bacterium]